MNLIYAKKKKRSNDLKVQKKINVKYMKWWKKIINSKRLKVPPKKKKIDLGGKQANK